MLRFTRTVAPRLARSVYSPAQRGLPRHANAAALYADIRALTAAGGDYTVRNYMAVIEDISETGALVGDPGGDQTAPSR